MPRSLEHFNGHEPTKTPSGKIVLYSHFKHSSFFASFLPPMQFIDQRPSAFDRGIEL